MLVTPNPSEPTHDWFLKPCLLKPEGVQLYVPWLNVGVEASTLRLHVTVGADDLPGFLVARRRIEVAAGGPALTLNRSSESDPDHRIRGIPQVSPLTAHRGYPLGPLLTAQARTALSGRCSKVSGIPEGVDR